MNGPITIEVASHEVMKKVVWDIGRVGKVRRAFARSEAVIADEFLGKNG